MSEYTNGDLPNEKPHLQRGKPKIGQFDENICALGVSI
jgi:hypothetical protein